MQRVTVTDIDISFSQMVWLLIKLSIAVIPAVVILTLAGGLVGVFLAPILAVLAR